MDERAARHAAAIDGFVAALARAPDATVPFYPSWQVRDLALHVATVHTMATLACRTDAIERPRVALELDRDAPVGVLTRALQEVADGFRTAVDGCPHPQVWALGEPHPPAFWWRRMTMEAVLHRFDAEAATGEPPATPSDAHGLDGIDEFLAVHLRRGLARLEVPVPGRIEVVAGDVRWTVELATGRAERRADQAPDATAGASVTGAPAAVWLWCNRRGPLPSSVEVDDRDGSGATLVRILDGLGGPAG